MLLAFQKVGLSCRETAFSLGASQAFSDGTATGTFETRFGAIVNKRCMSAVLSLKSVFESGSTAPVITKT